MSLKHSVALADGQVVTVFLSRHGTALEIYEIDFEDGGLAPIERPPGGPFPSIEETLAVAKELLSARSRRRDSAPPVNALVSNSEGIQTGATPRKSRCTKSLASAFRVT